ncbi:hypothetical protein KKD19_03060 [Patescibacteria group bacterium]|nr:hypothetical protein [Patescibacteria group bacterium]MBU4512195.1 hypothetical protein [Patescibacteria group bacterium]MCG2693456.1 hypothetical protein [Candidatus Parcubacteria bacterium]
MTKTNDVLIIPLDEKEFEAFKKRAQALGAEIDMEEKIALSDKSGGIPCILLSTAVMALEPVKREIIIAHERAHVIAGIGDQEEADRWALDALCGEARKILIDMWETRHGHPYKKRSNKNNTIPKVSQLPRHTAERRIKWQIKPKNYGEEYIIFSN